MSKFIIPVRVQEILINIENCNKLSIEYSQLKRIAIERYFENQSLEDVLKLLLEKDSETCLYVKVDKFLSSYYDEDYYKED